jgi:hypothetical protein
MTNYKFKKVLDNYFEFIDSIGGNHYIEEMVPLAMIDNSIAPRFSGMIKWKAIKSTLTDNDIIDIENYYKHKLPDSYIEFLKYKHFIELILGRNSINFFSNLPDTFIKDTQSTIDQDFSKLINKNYLPFARFSDSGVLCFDANTSKEDNEYSIVSFDHENGYKDSEFYAIDFDSMFFEFEENLIDWIKTKKNN